MMVKWANDGLLQANDGKMLVNDGEMLANDGEMLVNDGEMIIWSYTHFTIIDYHFTIIDEYFTIISLKYTIVCWIDHHWEAAPTGVCTRFIHFRSILNTFMKYRILPIFKVSNWRFWIILWFLSTSFEKNLIQPPGEPRDII